MALVFLAAQAFAAWDDWHTGYATPTTTGYSGGAALLDPISSDMEITALNYTDYNYNGVYAGLAGAYLQVYGPNGNSTVVYVTDTYPEGPAGALDLCFTSFSKIGQLSAGQFNVRWRVVKGPVSGNFSYRIKDGTNPYWAAIQVRNHKYPVMKMEYYRNGGWNNMVKQGYNHFVGENLGSDPLQVRITDIRGVSVTDTIRGLPASGTYATSAYIVPGNVQFPDGPGDSGNTIANGTYKLVARHSGKAMDAYKQQTGNGTQIQQYSYWGGSGQKWTVTDTGSGYYKIMGVQSGKSLDIDYSYGGTANGTKVQLWSYWNGPSQQFKFAATDSGYYRITPNCATGSCLDVKGKSTADRALVQLYQWNGGNNQQWALQTP
jgi:expansin (peptidoglycan-binding protein)